MFDVVQVPHHGSGNNSTLKFFQTIKSRHYFITQSHAIKGLDQVLQALKSGFQDWKTQLSATERITVSFVWSQKEIAQFNRFIHIFHDESKIFCQHKNVFWSPKDKCYWTFSDRLYHLWRWMERSPGFTQDKCKSILLIITTIVWS